LATITGLFIASYLTARRDTEAKKNEIVVNYLIDAYDKLANASWRLPEDDGNPKAVEEAVAKIQLLGSLEEVRLLNSFLEEFSKLQKPGERQRASLDPLLNALRDNLRQRLSLAPLNGNIRWLRTKGAPQL
jgi:hypothetical protein